MCMDDDSLVKQKRTYAQNIINKTKRIADCTLLNWHSNSTNVKVDNLLLHSMNRVNNIIVNKWSKIISISKRYILFLINLISEKSDAVNVIKHLPFLRSTQIFYNLFHKISTFCCILRFSLSVINLLISSTKLYAFINVLLSTSQKTLRSYELKIIKINRRKSTSFSNDYNYCICFQKTSPNMNKSRISLMCHSSIRSKRDT